MGCTISKTDDELSFTQAPVLQTQEFSVFVPGIRLPKKLQIRSVPHEDSISTKTLIDKLVTRHSKLVSTADELVFPRKLRKKKSLLSGSSILGLREAIDEYFPVLVRLLKSDSWLSDRVVFTWTNQEDEIKETSFSSPHYELLSVLQLLATLLFIEANKALGHKPCVEGSQHKQIILDDNKKTAMDVLFNAAEILECALKSVLPQAPCDVRRKKSNNVHQRRDQLPADLTKGVLQALQLQALGQTVEIQLGLAIDNPKATMAVKRRLACEHLKYWQQAYENLQTVHLGNGWGEKHLVFVRWKRAQAKAAAYHFHGLILNEGSDKKRAEASLGAAEHFLKESERMCEDFISTAPMTKLLVGRLPSWGPIKYLSEKTSRDVAPLATSFDDKILEKLKLPDFPLALQVDQYEIPDVEIDDSEQLEETDSAPV